MGTKLLLDTQALILWAANPALLPRAVKNALADSNNEVHFSPVSAMEIATKVRIGKLDAARPLSKGFVDQMVRGGFVELPLLAVHAELAGSFESGNNDPWDRLLAAQARIEQMALVTNDRRMDDFGVRIFW